MTVIKVKQYSNSLIKQKYFSELYYDRGNHHEFTSLVKELARPGEITGNTTYGFEFQQVEKPYESYTGANVRLRYVVDLKVWCYGVRLIENKRCQIYMHMFTEFKTSVILDICIKFDVPLLHQVVE